MPGSLAPLQVVDDPTANQNFEQIYRSWPAEPTFDGAGSPEGVVSAGPGALYRNRSTGDLYVHVASTVSTTGWQLVRAGNIAGTIRATITGTASLPAQGALGGISKISMNTVVVDSHSWWNTGTARYVPQVAGRYLVTAHFHGTAVGTAGATIWDLGVAVTGGVVAPDRRPVSTAYGPELNIARQVILNGTTDYVELWGAQSASGTAITGSEQMDIVYLGSG